MASTEFLGLINRALRVILGALNTQICLRIHADFIGYICELVWRWEVTGGQISDKVIQQACARSSVISWAFADFLFTSLSTMGAGKTLCTV